MVGDNWSSEQIFTGTFCWVSVTDTFFLAFKNKHKKDTYNVKTAFRHLLLVFHVTSDKILKSKLARPAKFSGNTAGIFLNKVSPGVFVIKVK